jgi:hypothetical protein
MAFDEATLARIRGVRLVEIETTSAKGAVHRAVIWIVADAAHAYIRSVRGERGRWYRELRDRPVGALLFEGERVPIRADPAPGKASVELVNRLFAEKYGAKSRSTQSMLQPETLPTTLRLDPG